MAVAASTVVPSESVAQKSPGSPAKVLTDRVEVHVDDAVVRLDALDHAADGVLGPFAGGHQPGVAGQDRRAAEAVGLVDQHDALPGRGKRVRRRQTGRAAADDEDRALHSAAPRCGNGGDRLDVAGTGGDRALRIVERLDACRP